MIKHYLYKLPSRLQNTQHNAASIVVTITITKLTNLFPPVYTIANVQVKSTCGIPTMLQTNHKAITNKTSVSVFQY